MNVTSLEPKSKITPNYCCNIISKLFFNQNMFKVEAKFCQANNHCALVEKKSNAEAFTGSAIIIVETAQHRGRWDLEGGREVWVCALVLPPTELHDLKQVIYSSWDSISNCQMSIIMSTSPELPWEYGKCICEWLRPGSYWTWLILDSGWINEQITKLGGFFSYLSTNTKVIFLVNIGTTGWGRPLLVS